MVTNIRKKWGRTLVEKSPRGVTMKSSDGQSKGFEEGIASFVTLYQQITDPSAVHSVEMTNRGLNDLLKAMEESGVFPCWTLGDSDQEKKRRLSFTPEPPGSVKIGFYTLTDAAPTIADALRDLAWLKRMGIHPARAGHALHLAVTHARVVADQRQILVLGSPLANDFFTSYPILQRLGGRSELSLLHSWAYKHFHGWHVAVVVP